MPPLESFLPAETYEDALRSASKIWGVQEEYWDIWGNRHVAPPAVQKAVLSALGVPAETKEALNFAIEERLWSEWSTVAAPTLVLSLSGGTLPIQIPAEMRNQTVEAEFIWENGRTSRISYPLTELPEAGRAALRGRILLRLLLPLPSASSLGYHTLRVRAGSMMSESRLILCPDRAYKPAFLERGGKAAGVAVSLYALRSARNWGCGDFTDLRSFTEWVATDVGASFVALNPLHSIPNRQPYNTSPYLPNCSFYRNPLYIDVEAVEDLRRSKLGARLLASPKTQERLADLRKTEYVEYEKVFHLKRCFLKVAFREFLREYRAKGPRAEEFKAYVEREGELLDRYALYSALDEVLHKQNPNIWIWPDWPEEYKDLRSPAITAFTRAHWRLILFYKYMQWQLDQQLASAQSFAKNCGLSIGLYHDLALATDRCGSDLWAYGEFYTSGCRVGSPPDDFAPKGQDWAFPPPNALCHRQDGYRLFVESIRKNLKHGGALRIDHVMRFFRLFWIPEGQDATAGVYVRDFSEDLLRLLALESVRNQVIVIGEDLGTVEPYIREALKVFGVLSYRLLYFERHEDRTFKTPDEYPRQALVSVSTHDLPTLVGFWESRDIEARRKAGVLPEESFQQQLREREAEKQKLLDLFFKVNLLPPGFPRNATELPQFTGELHNAAVGFLASTPSELMVLNQEDLFKDPEQQNLPGTTEQYPNWRHKMFYATEELRSEPQARDCTSMFRYWLERTGRLNL